MELEQIIKQTPVFLNDWDCKESVESDFRTSLADVNVLFASYTYINYNGDAFVLFEKDGKLFEVNGYHCSCYGLEGQWQPEETTLEALRFYLYKGSMGVGRIYANELKAFLG